MPYELDPRSVLADSRWLAGLARALVADPGLAEDACQEVWLAAGRTNRPGWRPTRSWLAGALRRSIAAARRAAARRREREARAARRQELPSTAELVERSEVQQVVARELLALQEPYRSALLLVFQEGLSAREVARRMGCPADTVRWRVRRGLELLGERLARQRGSDWRAWVLGGLPSTLRSTPSQASALGVLAMNVKTLSFALVLVGLIGGVTLLSGSPWSPTPAVDPPGEDRGRLAAGGPAEPERSTVLPAQTRRKVPIEASAPGSEPRDVPDDLFVRGRVLSPGGDGVVGATVCTGTLFELVQLLAQGELAGELPRVQTVDGGRFLLEGLAPGATRLVAGKEGSTPSAEMILDLGGSYQGDEVVLVLRVGARIHGEVLRIDGAPMGETPLRLLQKETGLKRTVTTDAEGGFDERCLNAGEWELVCLPDASLVEELGGSIVDHLSQTTVTVEEGEERFVTLGGTPPPGVVVRGGLTQDGAPFQGSLHWMAEGPDAASHQKFLESDEQGHYEVELTRAGPWFVKVAGPQGHQEFRVDVPATSESTLDFALPSGVLSGVVADSGGEPVAGARVSLFLEEGAEYRHDLSGMQDQRITAGDGAFEYRCLPPGRYLLAAEDEEGHLALAARHGLSLEAGSVIDGVRLVLGEGHGITGRVVDSRGLPAAQAPLWIYDGEGRLLNPITATRTDDEGAFRTSPLPAGEYTLHCRTDREALLTEEGVRVPRGEGDAELELQLEAGAVLAATVVDSLDRPLRAQVRVHDRGGRVLTGLRDRHHPWAWQRWGLDSRLDWVGPLPPGAYDVSAFVEGRGTTSQPVELLPGEPLELRLSVP